MSSQMLTTFAVTALCGFLVSSHPIPQPSLNCSFPIAPTCESAPGHSIERRGMSASSAKGGSSGKGRSVRFTSTMSTQTSHTTSTMSTQTLTQSPLLQLSTFHTLPPTFAVGTPTRPPTTNADSPLANLKDKSADGSAATLYLFIALLGLIILVLFLTCLKIRRDRQNANTPKDVELIVANKIMIPPVDYGEMDNEYLEPVVNDQMYDTPNELESVRDTYYLPQRPPVTPVLYSLAN